MEKFLDLKVNLEEFGNIYNEYTDRKMNFGGGFTTVRELLTNATFLEEEKRKLQGGDSESGTFFSSLFNSLYLDDTNNNSYYSDNFFHTTLPANNTSSFTDVSSTWDMKSNYFSYPDAQPVKRSFVF